MKMGDFGWSDLPEELVDLIADRVSSHIDLLRCRSICKPWRSVVATKKRFSYRFERRLPDIKKKRTALSPTSFFRVTLPSSCPNKGWLIKTRQAFEYRKITILSPLSGKVITTYHQPLDLLKFGVSEIRQSYNVQYCDLTTIKVDPATNFPISTQVLANSTGAVLVDNMVFAVDHDNNIWCCKGAEESSTWRRIESEEAKNFSDIIVQKGKIYALGLKGAIWWISLSELNLFQYTPSTPVEDYNDDEYDYTIDKRLVEYCGDLCIVYRFRKADIKTTIGFKVYKMDENLVEWVQVSSLGDKTLIVSTDSCFTVSASEYYGCLENAIYFADEYIVKVFKLDDGSIINMTDTSSHSCFQMFSHPFL